jgi:hypothetical protein
VDRVAVSGREGHRTIIGYRSQLLEDAVELDINLRLPPVSILCIVTINNITSYYNH